MQLSDNVTGFASPLLRPRVAQLAAGWSRHPGSHDGQKADLGRASLLRLSP